MRRTPVNCVAFLALVIALFLLPICERAQNAGTKFTFRPGLSMYIVAFQRLQQPVTVDLSTRDASVSDYSDLDLDAERKVRTRVEKWTTLKVADKLSDADFVLLIHLDNASMEGLAIPVSAYHQHFKEKFDLDALREAAYGRYLAGPLKMLTLGRLSDRLVNQFREKVPAISNGKK